MNYINNIKNIINKLEKLKSLHDKNQLTNDDPLISFVMSDKAFEDLEKLHIYLINKVNRIHKNETSEINTDLCKKSLNLSECLESCSDAKRGGKIYFLNDKTAINYIFGDIHSDSYSLFKFLKKIDFIRRIQNTENLRLVFLGDYIDRGKAQFKVIETILILKYIFPHNIFLLKGNHDGGEIISENEYKLCVKRNEDTTDDDYFVASVFNRLKELGKPLTLLKKYLKLFYGLCHAAVIKNGNETVLCVHGGIPRPRNDKYSHIESASDLWSNKKRDHLKGSIVHNMLWSDPAEDTSMQRDTRRFYFYESNFTEFAKIMSIDTVIRAHQAFENGYKEFFGGRLISVFSSGDTDNNNNETAYKNIIPCVLELHSGDKELIRL